VYHQGPNPVDRVDVVRARRIAISGTAALLLITAATLALSATAALARWQPPSRLSWYWQLTGTVNNSYPAAAYDIDGFDNSRGEVATLHSAKKHVICYIDVGTWENWRPDASKFPSSALGKENGWPGERWLDIRQLSVLEPLMTARFQMCSQKGFDAVEPDNIDGYENDTGFPISAQDQLTYDAWVAKEAHSLGLAVFQKNDPEQAAQLEPDFDGVLDEQCNEYSECSSFQPYLRAGKPVLNAEYNLQTSQFCPADNRAGIMGALYNLNLDGSTYQPCWSGSPGFGPAGGDHGVAAWKVAIGAGSLTDSRGATAVRLTCPRGQSYCDGTVEIDAAAANGGFALGRGHFHLAGGHAATVRLTLSGTSLRKLRGVSSARATIKVDARNRAGTRAKSQRTTTLRLPA
jgi:hypothetical protein